MSKEDASTRRHQPHPRAEEDHARAAARAARLHQLMQWILIIPIFAGAVALHITTAQPGYWSPVLVTPVGRHCFTTDLSPSQDR